MKSKNAVIIENLPRLKEEETKGLTPEGEKKRPKEKKVITNY